MQKPSTSPRLLCQCKLNIYVPFFFHAKAVLAQFDQGGIPFHRSFEWTTSDYVANLSIKLFMPSFLTISLPLRSFFPQSAGDPSRFVVSFSLVPHFLLFLLNPLFLCSLLLDLPLFRPLVWLSVGTVLTLIKLLFFFSFLSIRTVFVYRIRA